MLALPLSVVLLAVAPADSRLTFLDSMKAELDRNQKQLKLNSHEAPYFISYQVKDYDQREVSARFGAIFTDGAWRDRQVYVDVRVGSYEFDNSIDQGMDFSFSSKGTSYVARKA